jgi:hypothetical protein
MSVDPNRRSFPGSDSLYKHAGELAVTVAAGSSESAVHEDAAASPGAADAVEWTAAETSQVQVQTVRARLEQMNAALEAVRDELASSTAEYNRLARQAYDAADTDEAHQAYTQAREHRAALVEQWLGLAAQIKELQSRHIASPARTPAQRLAAGLRALAAVKEVNEGSPGRRTLPSRTVRSHRRRLRDSAYLLDRHEELVADQGRLRALLGSGVLDSLPPPELDELRQLAALDLQGQFMRLSRLELLVMQASNRPRH